MKSNKNRNVLFIIPSIIGTMFIISPLLLRIPCIRVLFSYFLQPLVDSGYKSSYIETFGAILGTFLAVTGTLWAQKKIDEVADKKEIKESALIVYYDFKFAFDDLATFMVSYLKSQRKIINTINDLEKYKEFKKKYRIYTDNAWIHNVAKLSPILSNDEIEIIYKLYGDLSTIKKVFNTPINEMSEDEEQSAYFIMFYNLFNIKAKLKRPMRIDVTLKDNIIKIMDRLKRISNISDKNKSI